MSKVLGREAIGKKEGKTKEVTVEEWGGSILIRKLSHREVLAIQDMASKAVDGDTKKVKNMGKLSEFNFELIRLSWVDASGQPVLEPADYDSLIDEPNTVIKLLTTEMAAWSGLNEDAKKDAEKNSQMILNGASGSALPSPSAARP